MREISFFIVLTILTVQDMKQKKLSLAVIGAGILTGILFQCIQSTHSVWDLGFGLVSGLFCCAASVISKGQIGFGDGLVLLLCTLFYGGTISVGIYFTASVIACIYIGVQLIRKKIKKHSRIPFIPFVEISYIFTVVISVVRGEKI